MRLLSLFLILPLFPLTGFSQNDSLKRMEIGLVAAAFTGWQCTNLSNSLLGNTNGFAIGGALNRRLSKRLSIEPGLLYVYYDGILICDSTGPLPNNQFSGYRCYGSRNEQLRSIKIPVMVDYSLISGKRMSFNTMAGGYYELLLKKWSRLGDERCGDYFAHFVFFRLGTGVDYNASDTLTLKFRMIGETMANAALSMGLYVTASFKI